MAVKYIYEGCQEKWIIMNNFTCFKLIVSTGKLNFFAVFELLYSLSCTNCLKCFVLVVEVEW